MLLLDIIGVELENGTKLRLRCQPMPFNHAIDTGSHTVRTLIVTFYNCSWQSSAVIGHVSTSTVRLSRLTTTVIKRQAGQASRTMYGPY